MSSEQGKNSRFDLLNVHYSDDERVIFLSIGGRTRQINLEKMADDPGSMPWVISSSDVRDAFGDSYVEGLSAFIGRLAGKCNSQRINLPLRQIDMNDVEVAAEGGSDLLNDLVRRTIENADSRR